MVIRGLHTAEQTKLAREGAEYLMYEHEKAKDGGKGEQAFGKLPEGSRSSWGRCEEPRLMKYFEFEENHKMCEDIIGKFEFKNNHPGPGYYTFAPRFYQWHQNPKVGENDKQIKVYEPYDVKNLPDSLSDWSQEFLRNADELGMKFSSTHDTNWHIDGVDYNHVAS